MRKAALLFIGSALLFSCGSKPSENKNTETVELPLVAQGGKSYGGIFRLNESEYVDNLFPPHIVEPHTARVANQIFNGLFKFSQDSLTLEKDLVESYTVNNNNSVFVFKLKQGVLFHDDACFKDGKGRELKAKDVQFCFEELCNDDSLNQGFVVFHDFLKGANDYFSKSSTANKLSHVNGIKVLDEYTIQLTLAKPNALFLHNLAEPFTYIYPNEAFEKYGALIGLHPVGTGPFLLAQAEDFVEKESITLHRNSNYFEIDEYGNQLPFLEGLAITFENDKKQEVEKFKHNELDMIYHLPTDYIIELMEHNNDNEDIHDYIHQNTPEMSTHFLGFLTSNKSPFKNLNLRKALSFGINREKIVGFVLDGEAHEEGIYGITPPNAFPNYHAHKLKGYSLNLDSANYYLKLSGKNINGITLDYNMDGERNFRVAQEIKTQLKENLGIEIKINPQPLQKHMEHIVNGESKFYLIDWMYEYPHPENFLLSFYSHEINKDHNKSFPNNSRFENTEYDALLETAIYETHLERISQEFFEAEQRLMEEAPVVVLWYDESYRLLQHYVKDFPNNAMQYRDFSTVYIAKPRLIKEETKDSLDKLN